MGVDLGGTNLRVGLVDHMGNIHNELNIGTEAHKGPDYVIKNMIELIKEVKGEKSVFAVGVGAPGPLDTKKGVILDPPYLPGWYGIPFVHTLEQETGLKVILDNDANAAALAESLFGAGQGYESSYYITVSTGVGGAFVFNGKVFQGAQGYAGEIGNMVINPNGEKHSSLNRGALEGIASGTAIARAGEQRLGLMGGTEEVFHAALKGNDEATKIIDEAITALSIGIANLAHAINPAIFILGGGVLKSEQQLLNPLRLKVKEYLYPELQQTIEIVPANLGTKAGVIGAAFLPY
ncbi:ROK family protein [Bacillus sp. PS06]|nr:ROK family protein [Bacillus sp. PS06]